MSQADVQPWQASQSSQSSQMFTAQPTAGTLQDRRTQNGQGDQQQVGLMQQSHGNPFMDSDGLRTVPKGGSQAAPPISPPTFPHQNDMFSFGFGGPLGGPPDLVPGQQLQPPPGLSASPSLPQGRPIVPPPAPPQPPAQVHVPVAGYLPSDAEQPPRLHEEHVLHHHPVKKSEWKYDQTVGNYMELTVLPPTPREWTPSTSCLDSRATYTMTIPRAIPTTDWARKNGLSGRDPRTIFLHEVLQNSVWGYQFRQVASGQFFCLELYESLIERSIAHGVHYVLRRKMRMKADDIREKILAMALRSGINTSTDSQAVSKVCDHLGEAVGNLLMGTHTVVLNDAPARLKQEAQHEVARLQAVIAELEQKTLRMDEDFRQQRDELKRQVDQLSEERNALRTESATTTAENRRLRSELRDCKDKLLRKDDRPSRPYSIQIREGMHVR